MPATAVTQMTTEEHLAKPGWWPRKGDASRSDYVGAEICAECHSALVSSQQKHAMAHTSSRVTNAADVTQAVHFTNGPARYYRARGGGASARRLPRASGRGRRRPGSAPPSAAGPSEQPVQHGPEPFTARRQPEEGRGDGGGASSRAITPAARARGAGPRGGWTRPPAARRADRCTGRPAERELADDQQRPAVADHVQRLRDRAVLRAGPHRRADSSSRSLSFLSPRFRTLSRPSTGDKSP